MSEPEYFHAELPNGTTRPAPRVEVYPARSGTGNGRGLVIFPGGGYQGLAGHEGLGYAEFYRQHGYACFVVTYRLAPQGFRHPAMLEDAAAAVHTVRARAAEFGIEAGAIGVVGSSAGGHLSACLMTLYKDFLPGANCRPDFGILSYPVITFEGENPHLGSLHNLLGPNPPAGLVHRLSCQHQVTKETPPCFLWHTATDAVVPMEHSQLYAAALNRCGVETELHIYRKGYHGLGLNTHYPWGNESLRWMDEILASKS